MPRSSMSKAKPAPPEDSSESDEGDLPLDNLIDNDIERTLLSNTKFKDLNLSDLTQRALSNAKLTQPSRIQESTIPLALEGRDILGAAATGSGKTLAFVIPVIEALFKESFEPHDGLGALVLSPTRELARQIFQVLNVVGKGHSMSAGLLVGGNSESGFQLEQERVMNMNILVGTPGRILEHMDKTPGFFVDNLKVLVLDEADRLLDLGFKPSILAILEHLPKKRQTILFSATQTKRIKDLADLSLKDPAYVSVNEQEKAPRGLSQYYINTVLQDKLNVLWSFLCRHSRRKVIVFFATCKQVASAISLFIFLNEKYSSRLYLYHLSGRKSHLMRTTQYSEFLNCTYGVMFATDLASRGLDFPDIEWVVQFDVPNDVEQYVHRAGRTARFQKQGNSVIFITPPEEPFLQALELINMIPKRLKIEASHSISQAARELCVKDHDFKERADGVVKAYSRFLQLGRRRAWRREWEKWDWSGFSTSLGLLEMGEREEFSQMQPSSMSKPAKENRSFTATANRDGSGEEEFLKPVKSVMESAVDPKFHARKAATMSQRQVLKANQKARKSMKTGDHFKFDSDGNATRVDHLETEKEFKKRDHVKERSEFFMREKKRMEQEDLHDKIIATKKRHERRERKREKQRVERAHNIDVTGVSLGMGNSDSEEADVEMEEEGKRIAKRRKVP